MLPRNINAHTFVCLLMVFINLVISQSVENVPTQNPCGSKVTCTECIQTRSCAWCMALDVENTPRCFQPSSIQKKFCSEAEIYNPANELKVTLKRQLTTRGSASGGMYANGSSMSGSYGYGTSGSYGAGGSYGYGGGAAAHQDIVQIYPQRVSMQLRINQKQTLDISYSQAEDYPVDLYYLMDLSKSMEDDKTSLSFLGDKLSDTMRRITSNFHLGFGSFVDKVLMPYVSTVPKKLLHPCDDCEAPYGFRNHMPLSMDTRLFAENVRKAAVSGNLDAPEGGFDAIMQSIVCWREIGWREKARKLLVFSTDAGFHYAGDGKLGGVITPNDGECHLDRSGEYTHSTVQDYPSISHINQKVKENSVNIIFAVTAQQIQVYNLLSEHIEGSSSAILSNDSSNVVDLVREEYSKISSSVEMKDNATNAIKITYYSSCLNNTPPVKTNKCDGLKVGNLVTFTAEITVVSCPANPADWFQTFKIHPFGLNESLIVDLEMLCDCPCEKEGHDMYEKNSTKCGSHGNYKCGVCDCDPVHFGQACECSTSEPNTDSKRDYGCRPPDNSTQTDCNGRGICTCGECVCNKRDNPEEQYSGKYCECDNFSCDRHNQQLCSGPERGSCVCGDCVCEPGWEGPACDCSSLTDTCKSPDSDQLCNGNGECVCGQCICQSTDEGRWSGKYCEKCPTCGGRCHDLKACVQCQQYKSGPLMEDDLCSKNCTKIVPIGVETVVADETNGEYLCTFYDDDDCTFKFVYKEQGGKIEVRAQEERECPPKVFMLGIVLGVIAAIVLIGLALLMLWKLLTTIHDRREFARFEKDTMNATWDTGENPIYKQATSTFKNPTYAGK